MAEDPLIDPFNHAHTNSDVDQDVDSIHHTLGPGPEQAAPGNHTGHLITGAVNMYAGATIPAGWLLCDGSAVSRATYPKLFGTIGTAYGAGDGSTTFNLPNFTNAFPRGNTIGSGGSDTHQHNAVSAGTPSGTNSNTGTTDTRHQHTVPASTTSTSGAGQFVNVPTGSGATPAIFNHTHDFATPQTNLNPVIGGSHDHTGSGFTGNALPTHQHDTQNNVPKYVGLKFIIKT